MTGNRIGAALLALVTAAGAAGAQEPEAPASRPQPEPGRDAAARCAAALRDLASKDDAVREAAVNVLAEFAADHREQIVTRFDADDPQTRIAAVRVYRLRPVPDVAVSLAPLTSDRDPHVREEALLGLAGCSLEQGVAKAMSLLGSEREPRVLRQCFAILGRAREWQAVPRILLCLERIDDPYLRTKAFMTLRSITNLRRENDPAQWQEVWAEHCRQEENAKKTGPRPAR